MSDLEPATGMTKSYTRKYAFTNKKGGQFEAILEFHSNNDLETTYISNSSFKELAHNLEITLEELHFKYSPISKICKHEPQTQERCYNLDVVFSIFSELKAGMVLMDKRLCCKSKLPLCSSHTAYVRLITPQLFSTLKERACLRSKTIYIHQGSVSYPVEIFTVKALTNIRFIVILQDLTTGSGTLKSEINQSKNYYD